jgi:hypothetical protein
MIVDLESGLVAPIASRTTWQRAIRRGLVPLYDDTFFDITREYIARNEAAIRAVLGAERMDELMATLTAAEAAALAWHGSEPRLWSRLVRGLWTGFGVRTWRSRAAATLAGSQEKAQAWIGRAITTWETEGRVTAAEAATMRAHMHSAEFQAMLPHLGAHIIISIPLRFPLGSIARVAWTVGVLGVATGRLLMRRIDRRAWQQAWQIHSPLVALLSAVPGFGTFAYLAAKPVRSNRLVLRATADVALQKLPWRLYHRTGLPRLIARPLGATTDPGVAPVRPEIWLLPQPGFMAAMVHPDVTDHAARTRPIRIVPSRGAPRGTRLHRHRGPADRDPVSLPAA